MRLIGQVQACHQHQRAQGHVRGSDVHHGRQGLRCIPVSHFHDVSANAEGQLKHEQCAQQKCGLQQRALLRELHHDSCDYPGHQHRDHAGAHNVRLDAHPGVAVRGPQNQLHKDDARRGHGQVLERGSGSVFKFGFVPTPVGSREKGQARGEAEKDLGKRGMTRRDRHGQIK